MNLIASVMGTAIARVSNDEVMPPQGIAQRDIIPLVASRYAFHSSPQAGPGIGPQELLNFQSGLFAIGDQRIPITQLVVLPDGDAVMARDTDLAEVVLEDLIRQFDGQLGYRYAKSDVRRSYVSQVSVEFDPAFAKCVGPLSNINGLVNEALSPERGEYKLKRLTFGSEAAASSPMQPHVEQFVIRDFVIERRAGEPMEKNRFFSSAPMRTKEHLALLEKVERAGMGRS